MKPKGQERGCGRLRENFLLSPCRMATWAPVVSAPLSGIFIRSSDKKPHFPDPCHIRTSASVTMTPYLSYIHSSWSLLVIFFPRPPL